MCIGDLEAWIGDPHWQRARYRARASVGAITNYRGGFLRLYHDAGDESAPVAFSRSVAAALEGAGLRNHALTVSGPGDAPRAFHGLPTVGREVTLFEPEWLGPISRGEHPPWELPAVGELRVMGWVETHRLALWLGDGQAATGVLQYDLRSGDFRIESQEGGLPWRLDLKGQDAGAPVSVRINGRRYQTIADPCGVASFGR